MSVEIKETEHNFLAVNGKEVFISEDGVKAKEELTCNETRALREYLNSRDRHQAKRQHFVRMCSIRCSNNLSYKNKLEMDFQRYLRSLEGLFFEYRHLAQVEAKIIAKSKALNLIHKRCKPLDVQFSQASEHNKSIRLDYLYATTFLIDVNTPLQWQQLD